MADLLTGFAFFLVIEGLAYALAPSFLKRLAAVLPAVPEAHLRIAGLLAIVSGVGLVWLVRG